MPTSVNYLTSHLLPPSHPLHKSLKPFTKPPNKVSGERGFRSSRLRPSFSARTRCSALSVAYDTSPPAAAQFPSKPSPAEVSRTIMELSSIGTLSVVSPDGWPIGVGARFVVDLQGTPALCLREPKQLLANDCSSSFHVQLGQSRSSSRQCTLLGRLVKPDDGLLVKKLSSRWEKKFGENVDEDLIYLIMVKHVLQMEDFEDVVWVTSSEYSNAEPDPLRNFAEKIVYEMGSKHAEDVQRLCNIYVESDFQVTDAKLIWVDRLGFDLHVHSEGGVYAARVPFAREVTDEKGVKSSFNCMFHLAWEVEKGYVLPNFEKVNLLKKVR